MLILWVSRFLWLQNKPKSWALHHHADNCVWFSPNVALWLGTNISTLCLSVQATAAVNLTALVLYNCYSSYPNLKSVDKYHWSFKKKNQGNISLYAALMLGFMKSTSSVLKGSKTSRFSFRQPQQELYREWLVHRLSRLHHHLHEHLRDPRDNQKGKFDVCGVFTFVRLWAQLWVIWSTTVIGVVLLVNNSFNPFPAWTFLAGEFIEFSHPLSVQSQVMSSN